MAFITFEGGDGAGKSTQAAVLCEALRVTGIDVVSTREIGGTRRGEDVRILLTATEGDPWLPLSQALLLNAARHEHVERLIKPALAAGKWVVSDRFADSTRAYQGQGLGVDEAALAALDSLATGGLKPDLTFIFDIDPALGLSRLVAGGREKDRYEAMDLGFHRRLRQGYLTIASAEPRRCVVLDAAQPPDAVTNRIAQEVNRRLGVALA